MGCTLVLLTSFISYQIILERPAKVKIHPTCHCGLNRGQLVLTR